MPPPAVPLAPGTIRGRILVVEDNAINQLVAEGIVTKLGYQVDIVANGAEALIAEAASQYVALLMDCHMPVMDGFEATRQIRARGGRRPPHPHHRDDRQRDGRRSGTLSGRRDGRLCDQARVNIKDLGRDARVLWVFGEIPPELTYRAKATPVARAPRP